MGGFKGGLKWLLSPRLRQTLSPIVRWDDFLLDAWARASDGGAVGRELDLDLNGTVRKFQQLADESECSLLRRQDAMMRWLPMLSWNLDPHTTSMHLLAQAAVRIREQGWV